MHTVDTNTTLYKALDNVAQQYPQRDALVLGDARDSYSELGKRVDSLAAGLSQLGIGRNDNVGILLPVCRENLYAFFALAKLGAPFVPVSLELRAYEVRHILGDSEAVAMITLDQMHGHDYLAMVQEIQADLPDLRHVIVHGEGGSADHLRLSQLLETPSSLLEGEPVSADDLVGIMYTSGTTGLPKGASHTHRSFLSEIDVVLELFEPEDLVAVLNQFPMFHHSGIAVPLIFLLSGGKLVLARQFDPRETLRLIEEERISFLVGAPVTAMLILRMAAAEQRDLSSLRVFGMGGSLCPPELIRALREQLDCVVFNGLGITEAGFVATTRPEDPEHIQASTVGRPARGVEVRIVDDQRCEVPVGHEGEIACRSPMAMEGYYNRPEETAEVMDEEGWYYTGDIGSVDENGYLSILGRKKEMIIRGGENIYPAEIERFLATNPKVRMAAVIGEPSDVAGERVVAYVQPVEGMTLTEREVLDYCRGQIATYKIPQEVRFVESFPLSALRKVQKFKLRERATGSAEGIQS
jgi:acyl-CoA synthetase (AMP-forming)/AMP-acid ligase II